MNDPYAILGLKPTASEEDIKSAYRSLAKKLHPDLNDGNTDQNREFFEIQEAYQQLSDPGRRAAVDQSIAFGSGEAAEEFDSFDPEGKEFHSLFKGLFKDRVRNEGIRGTDVRYKVNVSFRDACRGGERRLLAKSGREFDIHIPAGSLHGDTITIPEAGRAGAYGGAAGDAVVNLIVEKDPEFSRDGLNLHSEARLPLDIAILGGVHTIETIHGPVRTTVPPQTTSGTHLKLKGRGIQPEGQPAGHHFVRVLVELPDPPDQLLTELISQWSDYRSKPDR